MAIVTSCRMRGESMRTAGITTRNTAMPITLRMPTPSRKSLEARRATVPEPGTVEAARARRARDRRKRAVAIRMPRRSVGARSQRSSAAARKPIARKPVAAWIASAVSMRLTGRRSGDGRAPENVHQRPPGPCLQATRSGTSGACKAAPPTSPAVASPSTSPSPRVTRGAPMAESAAKKGRAR